MFNHVRTLLLNNNGAPTLGDVDVPANFLPLTLPSWLQAIRAQLFGQTPDRAMLNYRLAQILPLLHVTDLAEYLSAVDTRVTYLDSPPLDLFAPANYVPQIFTNGGGTVYINGAPVVPDATGTMHYTITVATTASTIQINTYAPQAQQQLFTPPHDGGLFTPVALSTSGYTVLAPAANGLWTVEIYNQPQWTLGQLDMVLHVLGQPLLLQLFGVAPVEPYRTFANCFYNHPELAYRLGGLVLALAYRTDEIRRGAWHA